jgi:hypothetical protein
MVLYSMHRTMEALETTSPERWTNAWRRELAVVELLEVSQTARCFGPWKSSRAVVADLFSGDVGDHHDLLLAMDSAIVTRSGRLARIY